MNTQSQIVTMESLFQLAGINYNDLQENTEINIEEKNIKIKSYNIETNEVEFKPIVRLMRKEDSEMYEVNAGLGSFCFKGTPEHKIYIKDKGYMTLNDIYNTKEMLYCLVDNFKYELVLIKKVEGKFPVLDMTVQDNGNYFSEKILSKNSPEKIGVGEAMKFYASVRIKTSKAEQQKDDGEEGQSSVDVVMSVFKNKVGIPFRKAQFTLLSGVNGKYGIDTQKEIIEYAVKYDIIKKAGSWFSYEDNKIGQGVNNVKKYLDENPVLFENIKKQVSNLAEGERAKLNLKSESFNDKIDQAIEDSKETKRRRKKEDESETNTDNNNIE